VWWFSPARDAETAQFSAERRQIPAECTQAAAEQSHTPAEHTQTPAQRTLTEAEVAEVAEDGRDRQGEEGYNPTPPRTPAPKEGSLGRPPLASASDPSEAEPPSAALSHAQPASATFSDAELSLLKERGITEITPGQWMHTTEQADGRIVLTRAR